MGQERRVPEEKRLLLVDGHFNKFFDWTNPFPTDFEPVITMPAASLGESAGHAMGKSNIAVTAFPVLPTLMTEVANRSQQFWHRLKFIHERNQLTASVLISL